MLFYVILDSFCASFGLGYGLYYEFQDILKFMNSQGDPHFINGLLLLCAFGISVLASYLITLFFKFYLELVLNNITTIENLKRKRNEEAGNQQEDNNQYDLKPYYNLVQVFGMSKLSWFVPLQMESGRPVGDDMLWPINHHNDSQLAKDHSFVPKKDNLPLQQFNNQFLYSSKYYYHLYINNLDHHQLNQCSQLTRIV